jgi:hypothetical protein
MIKGSEFFKNLLCSLYTLNPDFAVGSKICTDATVGIKNTDALVGINDPEGQALWPDSDRKRHEPTKALFGALSGE